MDAYQGSENDFYELIDRLQNTILQARAVPFTSSCMVDKEELLLLAGMLRDNLPQQIKQAKWLVDHNHQVIADARREAEQLKLQAEKQVANMVDEHEITQKARQVAAQTIESANSSAKQIRQGALDYANKRLTDLEEQLTSILVTLQKNKKELR